LDGVLVKQAAVSEGIPDTVQKAGGDDAASATRNAVTKSFTTSLARWRKGPGNISMNQGLPRPGGQKGG